MSAQGIQLAAVAGDRVEYLSVAPLLGAGADLLADASALEALETAASQRRLRSSAARWAESLA